LLPELFCGGLSLFSRFDGPKLRSHLVAIAALASRLVLRIYENPLGLGGIFRPL
jgi:hypothetical protein